ncbi:MAG: PAS domain S-box protein [Deltaproteobacteria bacterium]|jgi:PAS domain S-box-containing protein|nr:PAS domain S-box protein [Deltaproteobacteria bacterium]
MRKKPSYEELQQKVKALEKQIIEVKESEAALRASEQNYRDLYENAPIAYFSINRNDGSILRFNSEAVRLLGYKRATLAQMNVLDLYADTAHGVSKAKALFERFQTGEAIRDEELQMKRLDGQLIWVNLNIEPAKSIGGDVVESRSVVIDISKRKQAENALRESEEKFRSVTEKSPSMIFINKKGKVVYCNKKCEEVMGYSREEFCSPNFDFRALIGEESKKTVESAFAKHLKGQEAEPYEYRLVTKGGNEFDAIITTKLIQYEGDKAILGIVTDITQRKEMEYALSESEAKFRALAESAPAVIIIVASEDLVYVNPAFESITGFTKEEALSMRPWELVHPDMQELVKERGLARQRGETVTNRYEIKIVTKDGQERWLDLSPALINYSGQTAILAIAYDITENKQDKDSLLVREQELKNKANDLEEMNAALRVLLKKRDEDKIEFEEKIQFNVKQLIDPYLYDFEKTRLSSRQATLLGIIKTNIDEIISPFARNFASIKYRLTPQEIKIASLIRQGKTTKIVAELMGLSLRTIEFHRTKIRHKMGLKDKTDSLQAYLLNLK